MQHSAVNHIYHLSKTKTWIHKWIQIQKFEKGRFKRMAYALATGNTPAKLVLLDEIMSSTLDPPNLPPDLLTTSNEFCSWNIAHKISVLVFWYLMLYRRLLDSRYACATTECRKVWQVHKLVTLYTVTKKTISLNYFGNFVKYQPILV